MASHIDDTRELRAQPEQLARWALETKAEAQVATYRALAFLARTEHAAVTLLPVAQLLIEETPVQDPDGFLRLPRGAVDHFASRSRRALAWMDQLAFFRERFPRACAERPPPGLFSLARAFNLHADSLEASVDLLVHECALPEVEDLLQKALPYPPLQQLLLKFREGDAQRSAQACRLASQLLGELSGARLWRVRKRLAASAGRAILGTRRLLDELEHAALPADRSRAAKGFARRLEDAISGLAGKRVLPAVLVTRLAGALRSMPEEASAEVAAAEGAAGDPSAVEHAGERDEAAFENAGEHARGHEADGRAASAGAAGAASTGAASAGAASDRVANEGAGTDRAASDGAASDHPASGGAAIRPARPV